MSNSVRPHRRKPTRLPRPWDSSDKNTGVGCHFLLQCMKVKSEREVAQSCPTLCDPMDCSLPGSSIHGIFQARVLEWGAIAFSISSTTLPYISLFEKMFLREGFKKQYSGNKPMPVGRWMQKIQWKDFASSSAICTTVPFVRKKCNQLFQLMH